jgi:hypothetical protein
MGLWRDHVLPRLVDKGLAGDAHAALRTRATAGLAGRVLEIGFGSGIGHRASGGHRTSAIGHRPSDIGRRASAIGHRASAIGHRLSGIEHWLSPYRTPTVERRQLTSMSDDR